jgi:tRNA(fMet)-specific endonuclease VapC
MYMLDTDSVSYALRGQGRLGTRIAQLRPSALCISAITAAELRFGADRRKWAKIHNLIDVFTATVAVVPFDDGCAAHYGTIASELARRGTPIGALDVLVAAHAMAIGATLVTNNVKHFSRVRGLDVENWL